MMHSNPKRQREEAVAPYPLAIRVTVGPCAIRVSAADTTLVVSQGKPWYVYEAGNPWRRGYGYMEGTGVGNLLHADGSLGSGDFLVQARLSLEKVEGTAASLVLGDNHFGFDGSDRAGERIGQPGDVGHADVRDGPGHVALGHARRRLDKAQCRSGSA
ncbi:MAG: hypothetical protein NTY19_48210 [Planctomycetota bacterium]|nr:hypothetical protein [Planctomycetota bacterium]